MLHLDAEWDERALEAIEDEVKRLRAVQPDLSEVAKLAAKWAWEKNREYRLSSIDREGYILAPIAQSTQERRARRGDGDGPPLVPNREQSRAIKNFVVNAIPKNDGLVISAQVQQAGFLHYHQAPYGDRPKRDILGIPNDEWSRFSDYILDEVEDQYHKTVNPGGFFRRALRGIFGLFKR